MSTMRGSSWWRSRSGGRSSGAARRLCVAGLVAEVDVGIDPLVSDAVGLGEAGCVVGVKADEGTEGGRLVAAEVSAGEMAIEVGGDHLGVGVIAEAGQGEAVGAAGVADLAGQKQVADARGTRCTGLRRSARPVVRREHHSWVRRASSSAAVIAAASWLRWRAKRSACGHSGRRTRRLFSSR